jgi:hypothetical protein
MSDLVDVLLKEMSIGDLTKEFARQAGLFARRGFQHARAEDQVRKWEERVDMLFGQFYEAYREIEPDAKENDCKAYIRRQPDYRKAQASLRRARYNSMVLKYAVKAFEVKGSMLMQLGADRRAEFENVDRLLQNMGPSDRKRKAERIIRDNATPPSSRKRRMKAGKKSKAERIIRESAAPPKKRRRR